MSTKRRHRSRKNPPLLAGLAPCRRAELLDSLANEAAVWISGHSPRVLELPKLLRVTPALVPAILARVARQGEAFRVVGQGAGARYELVRRPMKALKDYLAVARDRRGRRGDRPEKLKPEDEAIYGGD